MSIKPIFTLLWKIHRTTQRSKKTKKIKRIYNNYNACKNCNARAKCCASSQTHKTITEYGSKLQKAMNHKMEKQEYKDEYSKRSSVEGPFGIFKEQFHLEKEVVIERIKTKEKNKPRCTSIHSNQIIQHKQEIENTTEDLEDFCESTSIKNQLQLTATIF